MGLLKVDDSKVVPVSSGEHLIQAATADGVVKIRIKAEVDQGQNTIGILLKDEHDQKLKMQQAETAGKKAEAEAALHPTWTDPGTELMWTKKDNGSDVDWYQATAYCSKLQLAGYSDWRLPTIEELQGINDPSVSVRAVFDWGVSAVLVKGNLQLTGWQWSSSQGDTRGNPWTLGFGNGPPRNGFVSAHSYSMRALCVRRSGE
jgi:hypothetical protein